MTPEKAYTLGVRVKDIKVETYTGKYREDWIVFVQDGKHRRVLTQGGVISMFQWANNLRRLEDPECFA